MNNKFDLGRLVATPGALDATERTKQTLLEFITRHATGDWGTVDKSDAKANNHAITTGGRILSAYRLKDDTRIWVITEADRSSTCCLLPSEY